MRRAIFMVIVLSFFPLAFLPGDLSGGACSNSLSPPFIASGVKPNILIILDNSNSFDEDFYGNAVGSWSPASKSVVARAALQSVVTSLQDKADVGIMTFGLPSDTTQMQIHNAMPFASYNPNSYCPNPDPTNITTWPPQACVSYCTNPSDAVSAAACDAACPPNSSIGQTYTSFTGQLFTHNDGTQTNFPDLIITHYAAGNPTRARYCGLAYPKTQMWPYNNPKGFTTTVYYNQTDPFYDVSNDGILYGYSGADNPVSGHSPYSPAENAANTYTYCPNKQGTSDSWNVYTGPDGVTTSGCVNYRFVPTDSDWALGFYNWGQTMPWYWVGPTWFSMSSPGQQGYLNVPIGPLSNICFNSSGVSNGQSCSSVTDCPTPYNSSCSGSQYNQVYNMLNPNADTSPPCPPGSPGPSCSVCPQNLSGCTYMKACTASNKNSCSYVINAGNTPTAGTMKTALSYFNGTYTGQSSPISSVCQKNYVIFVTDGLPDTMLDGSQANSTTQYCYNSSGLSNNLTCSTTSDCAASYNAFCATSVMGQVLNQLAGLQANVSRTFNSTATIFPVKTYVLGVGLTATAKANLDQMAVAGGTATSTGTLIMPITPSQLTDALNSIIVDLLGRVSAGSSISILSEGQTQKGANMLQGVFYPTKYFGTTTVTWPGYLYNYWFYNSPRITT